MPLEFHNAIKFSLAPIALFLWMGEILLQTGVAFKAIGAIDRMISKVPGRLSVVSIVGGTVFSLSLAQLLRIRPFWVQSSCLI